MLKSDNDNDDMLNNSCDDNESRKLVGVSNEVVISTDEFEKEWRDSLNAEYKKLSLIHI